MNSITSSNTKETITYKTEVIPGKDIVLVKEREILIPIKTQTKTETYIIEENAPIEYGEEDAQHQGEILIEENSPRIEEEVEIVEQVSRTYESPKKSNLTQSEMFPEKSKTKFSKVLFSTEQASTPLKDKEKSSPMNMKLISSVDHSSNKKRGNNDSFISNLTQVAQKKKGPYDYTYLFRDDYITDEQPALSKSTFVNLKEGYRLSESQKSFSSIKDREREHKDSDGKLTQGIRTDLNWENLPNSLMNRSISHTMSSRGPRIPSTNKSVNVAYTNIGTINTNEPSHDKDMQVSNKTKVQTENWMNKPQSTRVRSYQMKNVNEQQSASNAVKESNDNNKMSYQQRREERRLRREKEETENRKREEFYRMKREREQKELEEKRKKESDEQKQQMVINELQRLRNLRKQNDVNNPLTTATTTTITTNVKDVVVDDKEVVPHDNEVIVTTKESELLPTKVVIERKGDTIIKTTTKETVKTIVKEIHEEEPIHIRYINDNSNESIAKEHNNFVYVINGNSTSTKTTNTTPVRIAPQHQQTITEISIITRKQQQQQTVDINEHNESIQPVVPEETTIQNVIQPQSSSLPIMNEKSISPIKNNSNSNSKQRIINEPGKESKLPTIDPIKPTTLFKTKKTTLTKEHNVLEKNLPLQVVPTDTTTISSTVDKKEINLPLNINSNSSTPKKPQIVNEERCGDNKGKKLDDVLSKVIDNKNEKKFVGEHQVETRIIDVEKRQGTPKKEISKDIKDNEERNVVMTTTVTTKKTLIVVKKEKTEDNTAIKEDIGVLPLNKENNDSKNVEQIKTVYINDNENESKTKEEVIVDKKSDNNNTHKETTVITTLTDNKNKDNDDKKDNNKKRNTNAMLTKIKPKEITAPSYYYIKDEIIEPEKDDDVVTKDKEVTEEPSKTTTTTTTTTVTTITTTVTSKEEPKTDNNNIITTSSTINDKPKETEPQNKTEDVPVLPITTTHKSEPQIEIKEDLTKKDTLNYTPVKQEPKTKPLTYITSTSNSYYPYQQEQQPSSSTFTTIITSTNTSTTPFETLLPPQHTPIIAPLRSSKPPTVRNQYVYKYEEEPITEEHYESTVNPNDINSMLSSQDLIHKSKRQPLHEQKAIFKNYYGRQGQSYAKDLTEIFSQDIQPDITTQLQSQRDNDITNEQTVNDDNKPSLQNTTTITHVISNSDTPMTEGNFHFKEIPPDPAPTQTQMNEVEPQSNFHRSKTMTPQCYSTLNIKEQESSISENKDTDVNHVSSVPQEKDNDSDKLYNEKGVIPGIIKAAVVPKKETQTEIKENENDNQHKGDNVVIKTTTITTTTTTTITKVLPDKEDEIKDDDNDTQQQSVIKFKFVGKNVNNQNNSRYQKNPVRYSVENDKDDDEIVTTVVPGGKGSTNLRFDSKRYVNDDDNDNNVIVEEEINDDKDKDDSDGYGNWRRFGKIAETNEKDDCEDVNEKGRYGNFEIIEGVSDDKKDVDNDEHRILVTEKEEPKEDKNDLSSTIEQWKGLSKVLLPKETITYINDHDVPKKEEEIITTTIIEPVSIKEEEQEKEVPRYICVENDNTEEIAQPIEQQQETTQPELSSATDLSEQPKKEEITTTTTTYVIHDDEQQPKETTTTTTIHYIVDDEPKKEETTTTVEHTTTKEIDLGPKELPKSKAGKRVRMQPKLLANTNSLGSTNLSSIMSKLENLPIEPIYKETQYTTTTITRDIKDDNVPKNVEIVITKDEPIKTQAVPTYTVEEIHKTGTPALQQEQMQPKLSSTTDTWKGLSEQPKETKYINTTIHYIVDDDDCPKKEEVIEPIETQHIERRDIPKDISEDTHKTGTPINVKQAEQIRPELSSAINQWKDVSKQPKEIETKYTTTTTYVIHDDEQQPKETTTTTTIHYIVDDEPKKEETTTTVEHTTTKEIDLGPKELPRSKAEETTKSETLIETLPYEYKHETTKPGLSAAMGQWKGLSEQSKENTTKCAPTTIHYIVDDDNFPKKEEISTITESIKTQQTEQIGIPKYSTVETYHIGTPIQPQHKQETTNPILSSTMGQWRTVSKQPKPKDTKYTTTHTYTYTESITPQKEVTPTIQTEQVTPPELEIKHQSTISNEKLQLTETPIQSHSQSSQQPITPSELSSHMNKWSTLSKHPQTTNPLPEETIISPLETSTITETQQVIPKVKSSPPKQRRYNQNESSPSLPSSNSNQINTLSVNETINQTSPSYSSSCQQPSTTIQQQIPLASPTPLTEQNSHQLEEPIEPEMQSQEDEIVHKFIEDIFNTVESEKADNISFQANPNETQQQFTPITDLNNNEISSQDNITTLPQLTLDQRCDDNNTSSIIPQIDPLQLIPLIPINDNINLEAPNLIQIPQTITLAEDNQPQQTVNEQMNIETVAEVYQPHRKQQVQVSQTKEIKTSIIPQQQSHELISSSTETQQQQQQQSITNDQQLFHTVSLKLGEVIFEQREIPISEVDTKLIQKPTLSSILKKQSSYEIQEEIITSTNIPEFERTRSSPTFKPKPTSSINKSNVRLGKAIQFEETESEPLITTNTFEYNPQLTPSIVTGASIDNSARKTAYPIKHKPRFETVVTESPSKYSHRSNLMSDYAPRKTAMTVMSLPKHILEEEEEEFHDVMQRGPQKIRAKKSKSKITSQKEHDPAKPANTPQNEDACGGCNGNENCVIM